jgi:hypothetical protein
MDDESRLMPADDEPFDLEREPLDAPALGEHDWGGDGTDPLRPVRAHVLEALRPNTAPYPPPVDALKQLGDPRDAGVAERRLALGLGQEHLQDLVRMARDRGLYTADSDTDEVWAPLHALLALDDLDTSAVVSELIPLFDLDDDWHATELPDLLGKVGSPALEPLRAYLTDHTRWGYGHALIADALTQIAEQHSELREQVVAILSDVLREAEHYSEDACTGAMDALVELEAVEALPLIRRAFELGRIDELMRGSWGDVLDDLGVEPEEDDPLLEESRRHFEERHERIMPRRQREELLEALARLSGRDPQHLFDDEPARPSQPAARVVQPAPPARAPQPAPRDARKAGQDKARKQKNKRKMEAASRKANRRKR